MSDRTRTTFSRAVAGYDADFEQALLEAIITAIAQASILTDVNNVVAVRTAETAAALIKALAGMLAMSPAAVRSPTALRRITDELRERLREAESDPELQDFLRRTFRGTETEGSA